METKTPVRVTVTIKQEAGHSTQTDYTRTPYHCPFCGKAEVFEEDEPWNHETTSVCLACGEDFIWNAGMGSDEADRRTD
jgi:predicted RNA-binding Zn-ribbon protein involved in translation (DUF1610 family)